MSTMTGSSMTDASMQIVRVTLNMGEKGRKGGRERGWREGGEGRREGGEEGGREGRYVKQSHLYQKEPFVHPLHTHSHLFVP